MPTTGTPWNIWYPDNTSPISPLENLFSTLSTSVAVALTSLNRIYSLSDLTAVAAKTGMITGDLAVTATANGGLILRYDGTNWIQINTGVFATTTARDTEYAKAAGVYKTSDLICYVTATKIFYKYLLASTSWKEWQSDSITYTPTTTGITLGTGGTVVASYKYVNGDIWVDYAITLGTGGVLTAQPTMTLPITARAPRHTSMTYAGGSSAFHSAGTNIAPVVVTASGASATIVTFWHTNSGAYAAVGVGAPFTFAAADVLQGKFQVVPA